MQLFLARLDDDDDAEARGAEANVYLRHDATLRGPLRPGEKEPFTHTFLKKYIAIAKRRARYVGGLSKPKQLATDSKTLHLQDAGRLLTRFWNVKGCKWNQIVAVCLVECLGKL